MIQACDKPKHRTIVLKFGGSVLSSEKHLRVAVHEIYRWVRDGWKVVAVISAFEGRTEQLLAGATRLSPSSSGHALAGLLACGERESSALLGLLLDRVGIPSCVLDPHTLGLECRGKSLESEPVSINIRHIEQAFETGEVVVIPGFFGVDENGRASTFGRGGSDLSAVFIAHQLNARCRLIKDVDALYTADPSSSTEQPRRYARAGYEDALRTDGTIIQHRSLRYAQRHGLEIELGRFNGTRPSIIGPGESLYDNEVDLPKTCRVAIAGLGCVGGGVAELVSFLDDHFEVCGAACQRLTDARASLPFPIVTEASTLLDQSPDVLVELIGGTETARDLVQSSLESSVHVVTGNKALIASRGPELKRTALANRVSIRYSASVAGGVPVLEHITSGGLVSFIGVLNGTSNFVLDRLNKGLNLQESIESAQRQGFAEADPERDLGGLDALDKLRVIAQHAGSDLEHCSTEEGCVTCWAQSDHRDFKPAYQVCSIHGDTAEVIIRPPKSGEQFLSVHDEWNCAVIDHLDGSRSRLRGRGAGRWATSESVVADLLELSRSLTQSTQARVECKEHRDAICSKT